MIKLFCFPRSGNSREVKIVLAEKGLPYESVDVHASEEIKSDSEFLKASPNAKVPAIIDGEVYLCESYKINEYLNQKYEQNPLLPECEEKRQQIESWVKKYDKDLCLQIGLLLIETILKSKEKQKEETKRRLKHKIHQALQDLEIQLKTKEYFFGEYSLADISLTPHIAAMPRLGVALTDDYPNFKAWFERIKSRPSFEASASPQPSIFVDK